MSSNKISQFNDILNKVSASSPINRAARSAPSTSVNASVLTNRVSGDDVVKFDISVDDDMFVTKIKEVINEKSLTLNEIYTAVGDKGTGYNMFYGLRQRTNMKLSVFERWLEILGYTWEINLVEL